MGVSWVKRFFCFLRHMKINLAKNKKLILILGTLFIFVFSFHFVLASDITANTIVQMVNDARKTEGLQTLAVNDQLTQAAEWKADDMAANNYFAHTSPKGLTPWYWIEKSNYDYKYAGENLAINFTNAEDEQKAWMASPTHRANIMNNHFLDIGVAVKKIDYQGASTIIAVQMFGSQTGAQIPVTAAPVKSETSATNPVSNQESVPQEPTAKIINEKPINITELKKSGAINNIQEFIGDNKDVLAKSSIFGLLGVLMMAIIANPIILIFSSFRLLLEQGGKTETYPNVHSINTEDYLNLIEKISHSTSRAERKKYEAEIKKMDINST
jgi:hypothetical protein